MSTTPLRRRLRRARRRTVAGAQLVALRAQLRVLAAVAPAAADRRALDVWMRIPVGAARRMDLRPRPGETTRVPLPSGSTALTEAWGDGPVVYLLHGWGGWRGQLGAFVEPLVQAGHRVVAVDVPSHGDAGPGLYGRGRGTVMEFIEALEAAVAHHGPAAGVVAHSMGTMAAAQAIDAGLGVDRLALVAPSHAFDDVVDEFATTLRLTARTREHLVGTLERVAGRPLAEFDLEALAAGGRMPETLVVHDRADRQTPHRVGVAIADTWPRARLLSKDGLGHHRVLAADDVVAAVVDHVRGRVPVG